MPSIIGSIPDIEVPPILRYLRTAGRPADYNEALIALLVAKLEL